MLTREQKCRFIKEGYLQLPSLVPDAMVGTALRAINHSIGEVGKTGGDPQQYRLDAFCHELTRTSIMTDVFNLTAIKTAVEDLLGQGNMLPVEHVQIAPRFPLPVDQEPEPYTGHLDGIGGGNNSMAKGVYVRNFTVFAVVYLVDVSAPESGNFTVWPHSHIEFQDWFRQVGHEVLSQGVPQIPFSHDRIMVTGRAGDVILAHHQLQHTAGHNISPHVRHALISRIRHRNVAAFDKGAYTDIWHEWEGISELTTDFR